MPRILMAILMYYRHNERSGLNMLFLSTLVLRSFVELAKELWLHFTEFHPLKTEAKQKENRVECKYRIAFP
jgi:hypothetical protein